MADISIPVLEYFLLRVQPPYKQPGIGYPNHLSQSFGLGIALRMAKQATNENSRLVPLYIQKYQTTENSGNLF